MSNPDLRDYLRSETRELHEQIESVNPILRESFSSRDYAEYLANLLPFYLAYDEKIQKLPPTLRNKLDVAKRLKAHLIRADLQALGHALPSSSKMDLSALTVEQLMGAMYVVEGSTHGGQFIARHLAKHLSLSSEQLHYFRCYDKETHLMWAQFVELLKSGMTKESFADVLMGAKITFGIFYKQMKQAI